MIYIVCLSSTEYYTGEEHFEIVGFYDNLDDAFNKLKKLFPKGRRKKIPKHVIGDGTHSGWINKHEFGEFNGAINEPHNPVDISELY